MKPVWVLWRTYETDEWWGIDRRDLVCICATYAAAVCRSAGIDTFDIEEVQVQE